MKERLAGGLAPPGQFTAGLKFVDLAAKEGSETKEFFGRDVFEVASGEFLLNGGLVSGEAAEFLLLVGEELLLAGFDLNEAQVVDFGAEGAVPINEGVFGD